MAKSCDDGDIIKNAAEGATKGFLDWSKEQVLELVERFKNGSLLLGNKYTSVLSKSNLKQENGIFQVNMSQIKISNVN